MTPVLLAPFLPLSFHQRIWMILGENCLLIFTANVLINVGWKEKLHHAAEIEEAPVTSAWWWSSPSPSPSPSPSSSPSPSRTQHLVPPSSFWSPTTFQNRQSPSSHWIQTCMWLLFLALWNGMPLLCWESKVYWGSIDTDIWRNGSYRLPGICFEGCIWSKHRKVVRRLQT